MSNKGEIRVKLILLIYVILCALSTLPTRVKTTIRNSPSWYFCASDILIFWVPFLLSSNSFFKENVSNVKITSTGFWAKERRAENEILLVHVGSLRDLVHKITHRDTLRRTKYKNISTANQIIIQRSVCIISSEWRENDVKNYADWWRESYLVVLFLVSSACNRVVGCHICLETRLLGQVPWNPCIYINCL